MAWKQQQRVFMCILGSRSKSHCPVSASIRVATIFQWVLGSVVVPPPHSEGGDKEEGSNAATDRLFLHYLTLSLSLCCRLFIPGSIDQTGRTSAAQTRCSLHPRAEGHRCYRCYLGNLLQYKTCMFDRCGPGEALPDWWVITLLYRNSWCTEDES